MSTGEFGDTGFIKTDGKSADGEDVSCAGDSFEKGIQVHDPKTTCTSLDCSQNTRPLTERSSAGTGANSAVGTVGR